MIAAPEDVMPLTLRTMVFFFFKNRDLFVSTGELSESVQNTEWFVSPEPFHLKTRPIISVSHLVERQRLTTIITSQ